MIISRSIHVAANGNFFSIFLFNGWVIFHCMHIPHLLYLFLCWWTFTLLLGLDCCQSCCNKHCCCSVTQLCPTLCNCIDYCTSGHPVLHHLPEFAQTHVHWVSDAIQLSYPLSSPSPHALNLSQHQGLFQWVSSSHQVAKVLELQHQSFQWIFRNYFL